MDFNYSDLQRMLHDSADRFITDRYTLEHRRAIRDSTEGFDATAWQQFAELGWLSILIPEELGGLEGSMADVCVLAEVLGSHGVIDPFASSAVLAATLLSQAFRPDAKLIAELAGGTARFALAHDEPGEAYAYALPRKTSLEPLGDGFVLNGHKMLALDAPSSSHYIVSAHGPEGLALVCVPSGAHGIHAETYTLYDGARAADPAFAQVRLGADALLASGEPAQALLTLALDRTRIALLAQSVGSMEAELRICSAYLKERQQFGQPIGKFQALQHIMADMFVEAHQARSALYFALASLDAPEPARTRAIARAKVKICEAAQFVSRQAIQLHGGYGLTDEYEVSHHYRRQLMIEKQYGDLDYSAQVATHEGST